ALRQQHDREAAAAGPELEDRVARPEERREELAVEDRHDLVRGDVHTERGRVAPLVTERRRTCVLLRVAFPAPARREGIRVIVARETPEPPTHRQGPTTNCATASPTARSKPTKKWSAPTRIAVCTGWFPVRRSSASRGQY